MLNCGPPFTDDTVKAPSPALSKTLLISIAQPMTCDVCACIYVDLVDAVASAFRLESVLELEMQI